MGPRVGSCSTTISYWMLAICMYAINLSPNGVNVGSPHAGTIVCSSIMATLLGALGSLLRSDAAMVRSDYVP